MSPSDLQNRLFAFLKRVRAENRESIGDPFFLEDVGYDMPAFSEKGYERAEAVLAATPPASDEPLARYAVRLRKELEAACAPLQKLKDDSECAAAGAVLDVLTEMDVVLHECEGC